MAAWVSRFNHPGQMVLVGHEHQWLRLLWGMAAASEVIEVLIGVRMFI